MNHDEEHWRQIVERFAQLTRQIAAADVNEIWNYGPELPGATPSKIEECEASQPAPLNSDHKKMLAATDGWQGFYHDVDLFGTDDFVQNEKIEKAWQILEAASEGSGGLISADRRKHIPIAAASFDIDVFVLELESGVVRWIAGQEIEVFPSIIAFFEGMLHYNEESLAALQRDPWLGVGSG
ncbi:hypothetical protein ACFW6V_34555 [Streptomyces sp. NPDC058734]|uniref:hypothetical protein n=1 Tax=Streptomyces sp. NPDC058734 TaxID=3346615 RepID=UPI00368897AC